MKRKNKNPMINEKVSEELNYAQIIFNQIQRISLQQTAPEMYGSSSNGVNALENLTVPHHDDEYFAELKQINAWVKESQAKCQVLGRIPDESANRIAFTSAKMKFRALMKLLARKDLLPEKEAIFDG